MNFFTPEQEAQLLSNGRPENRDQDHAPVVKLYIPFTHCVWLLSELEHDEPDIAFGLCDLGMGFPELGNVSLSELASINVADITVQRDDGFKAEHPMSVYAEAARSLGHITDDWFALLVAKTNLETARGDYNTPKPE